VTVVEVVEAVCGCGTAMRLAADNAVDEWRWEPLDGSPRTVEIGLPDGVTDSYMLVNYLRDRDIAAYSALSAALDLGANPFRHVHHPADVPSFVGPVPEHCGSPMWMRPSGWQCRAPGCESRLP